MKRLLSIVLAAVMLLGVMPWQVFAEGTESKQQVKYPVTIKFMEVRVASDAKEEEYTEHEVVFNSKDDTLGIQTTVPSTHEGQIRGRSFMGWTNVNKSEFSTSSSNRIYSANNTVGDVLANEKLGDDGKVTLYAYYDGVVARNVEIMGHYVPVPNENIDKHKYVFIHDELNKGNAIGNLFIKDEGDIRVKSVEENPRSNVQKNSWGEDLSNFAEGDRGSKLRDKTITSYYHPTIEESKINFQSAFNMHKGIALLVRNNGSWALSGSEVKLEVRIPDGMELEDTLSNVEFDSRTFRIKGVEATDKDNKKITATIENNSLSVEKNTFDISFESGKGKDVRNLKLIVEPKKRASWQGPAANQDAINDGMDALKATEVVKEMHWNGNSAAHFSKAKAKELAESQGSIELDGSVYGQILFSLNGQDYPLGIRELKSNVLTFKFVYPEVTFVKNTKALGDSAEQELAKIKAKQEDDKGTKLFIGDKDFPKDPTFNKDGKEVKFLGWNTKPDGTGDTFTSETDVKEDMKVYAIWEAKEEPQPNPTPQPDPQGPFYKGSILILPEEKEKEADREEHMAYIFGYPDKSVKPEGTLTRAEAAAMVTRLGNLDLSDATKADYPDLKDGAWYLPHINAALKAGMLDTDDAGGLRPDAPVTRGEFVKMIAAIDKASDGKAPFTDIAGHKYEKEINQVYGNGRALGYEDGSFKPDASLTRAEAAAFLNRVSNRVADDVAVLGLEDRLEKFTDLQKGTWYYYELVEATNSHELIRRGGQDELNRANEKWIAILQKRAAR